MKRFVVLAAVAAAVLLAGCAGAGSSAPLGSSALAGSAAPSGPGDLSAQFGGDVCSALTRADIEAATYGQGPAAFSGTDTQKDSATGQPVACQYLVTFGGNPSIVGAYVALADDGELQHRQQVALIQTPEPISGIGSEASVVLAAPGLYEVWVTGTHGKFTVGAQAKATAIALAAIAAGRN